MLLVSLQTLFWLVDWWWTLYDPCKSKVLEKNCYGEGHARKKRSRF